MRFFVTGTDTNVGKTEVSIALLQLLAERGHQPFAFKPWESGGDARTGDAARLQRAAGSWQPLETVCLYRFTHPLAPGIAAKLERKRTDWKRVLATLRSFGARPGVVEGAGGLHVPLDARHDVADLVRAAKLPVIVVARAGLGTINHTSLTLDALARLGARVAAVVLVQAVPGEDASIPYNRPELEARYPRARFIGPVPFIRPAARRQRALRKALEPLVVSAGSRRS